MMNKKYIIAAIVIIAAASAIMTAYPEKETGNGADRNGPPDNGGEFLIRDAVVENVDIMILESFPVQVRVSAQGYLPDGCTEIHEISKERKENEFTVRITTKRPQDALCTQAVVPFKESIALDAYGLEKGEYSVDVNGAVGSFELAVDNVIKD